VDIEEDAKNPIEEALELMKKESPQFREYHTLVVMMMGDPLLLFDEIGKICEPLKEPIQTLRLLIRLIGQNQHTFKEIMNAPEKLKDLEGQIGKYLVSPIINCIVDALQVHETFSLRRKERKRQPTSSSWWH
jgi:hypothetical protein